MLKHRFKRDWKWRVVIGVFLLFIGTIGYGEPGDEAVEACKK